jgi:hypothetical protein
MTLSNAGAATFSSSVTANYISSIISSSSNASPLILQNTSGWGSSQITSISVKDASDVVGAIGWKYDGVANVDMLFHSLYNGAYKNTSNVVMTVKGTGNVLIGTTTTPTPVSGVAFPLTVSSSAATRLRIDSTNASPNSGVGLYANGVQKFSFAMYGTDSDFTIYNDALLASALLVKGTNSNVLIGTTTDVGAKLYVDGAFRTGTLTAGTQTAAVDWRLGNARGGAATNNALIRVQINGVLVDLLGNYV